jgi:FdhD protein
MGSEAAQAAQVVRVRGQEAHAASDWLAIERPLEIRARVGGTTRVISTTMRTPGQDQALVAGFLFAEGVIANPRDLLALESVAEDVVLVELRPDALEALEATRRPFVTTGACGVCGRASIDGLQGFRETEREGGDDGAGPSLRWTVEAQVIHGMPGALREAQATFDRTGGLHAAGLFSADGTLRDVHEDVGRHNAVDKLVGTLLLDDCLPAVEALLVVSGRASFELVQKAAAAGVPVMVAVGAPSSLAVEIAEAAGLTLVGFARDQRFNVYAGARRVSGI